MANEGFRRSEAEVNPHFPEIAKENWGFHTFITSSYSNHSLYFYEKMKDFTETVSNLVFAANSTVSTNNLFCKRQVELTNQLLTCNQGDYCCKVNVYEKRFSYEMQYCNFPRKAAEFNTMKINTNTNNKTSSVNKQLLNMCTNLQNCRNICKQKVPMYDGCNDINIPKYNTVIDSCYQTCFAKEYNCPQAMITTNKNISVAEIIILVICLSSFSYCMLRYVLCASCYCNTNDSSRESKIHADTTVENYSNV